MRPIIYFLLTAIITFSYSNLAISYENNQKYSTYENNEPARLVNPLYQLTIANIQSESTGNSLYPTAVTFDIYIYHTNPEESGPFYYSSGQYYIRFNPGVANGGDLEYEIVPNSTEFTNPDAIPRNPSISVNRLNLERNLPILFINAPIVSSVFPGTKVIRMRLSSNTPVLNYRELDLAWIDSTIANPFTMISAFIDTVDTDITADGTLIVDTSYVIYPVELSAFSAEVNRNNVKLYWSTFSEFNNSGFDIERSNSTGIWEKIGFIKGNGSANSVFNYIYEDKDLKSSNYNYRLRQIDFNGNFEYFELNTDVSVGVPEDFSLKQNYPNPFNPTTKIDFDVPVNSDVSLNIYDINGKEIRKLINGTFSSGYYSVEFNASDLPSGIYYFRLSAVGAVKNFTNSKKMILLK